MKEGTNFKRSLRSAFAVFFISILTISAQTGNEDGVFKPSWSTGFNILVHNGVWGSTVPARPEGGDFYSTGGDPYTGLGYGVNINYRFMDILAFYFDINTYSNKTPLAYSGGFASSDWVWEMNDYNQRLVGPFTQNVNYSVNSTGMRLGLRAYYSLKNKRISPWYGIYWGYYTWTLGVFSEDKKSTYGNSSGNASSLMYLNIGVDISDKSESMAFTIFLEGGSPVARDYSIENCLVNGWTFNDYGEGTHLFGYYRIGASINFISRKKASR